jgi:hypothetical protein
MNKHNLGILLYTARVLPRLRASFALSGCRPQFLLPRLPDWLYQRADLCNVLGWLDDRLGGCHFAVIVELLLGPLFIVMKALGEVWRDAAPPRKALFSPRRVWQRQK